MVALLAESEAALQMRIASWNTRFLLPPPEGPYWCAINPVPTKSLTAAIKSKRMGMKAGIADFLMVWKGRPIAPELKTAKGRLSPAQLVFRREFTLAGGLTFEVRSFDDYVLMLDVLGVPMRKGALDS